MKVLDLKFLRKQYGGNIRVLRLFYCSSCLTTFMRSSWNIHLTQYKIQNIYTHLYLTVILLVQTTPFSFEVKISMYMSSWPSITFTFFGNAMKNSYTLNGSAEYHTGKTIFNVLLAYF